MYNPKNSGELLSPLGVGGTRTVANGPTPRLIHRQVAAESSYDEVERSGRVQGGPSRPPTQAPRVEAGGPGGPHRRPRPPPSPKGASYIHFIQANLQHSVSATGTLLQTVVGKVAPCVALIQEPWVHRGSVRGLSQKDLTLVCAASDLPSRACILLSKGLDALALPQLCSRDAAAVELLIDVGGHKQALVVASIYIPGNSAAF